MDELDRQLIGTRVKRAREEVGLTQPELGDLVGVTTRTIQNWEALGPPIRDVHKIEQATKRTQRWILYGDEADPVQAMHDEVLAEIRELSRKVDLLLARVDDPQVEEVTGISGSFRAT